MRYATRLLSYAAFCCLAPWCAVAESLYTMAGDTHSRWASFENPEGAKGEGGKANEGAKGAAFAPVAPGETKVLMEADGAGTVHRMWCTLSDRDPADLRAYVLRMYWDGAESPAVEVPLGDFFGHILGDMTAFESYLISSPEGRSFNCTIPMPFRDGAKITFTNESDEALQQLFYDINYTLTDAVDDKALYFHAVWNRERWTRLGRDFEILPKVSGRGRFLGAHVGIIGHPDNLGWWGEGEVKMYLDGDTDYPTLVGTGTEDYVGTAYGQGEFSNLYQGSLVVDDDRRHYTFYRHHVPDPVYFHEDIRVTIQQMGGAGKKAVLNLLSRGVDVDPVSIHGDHGFTALKEMDPTPHLADPELPDGWTNMYRRDDVSAVALFYLDGPENGLPRIAPVGKRTAALADG